MTRCIVQRVGCHRMVVYSTSNRRTNGQDHQNHKPGENLRSQPTRRGRPPRSKSMKPGAAPAAGKTRESAVAAKPITTPHKPPAASAGPRAGTVPAKRRPGRPPGSKSKLAPAPAVEKTRRMAANSAPAAPKPSKSELQAQVEKLERTVTTLRTRSREAVRAAKQAATRIEELEAQLATMERQAPKPPVVAQSPAPKRALKRAAAAPSDPKPVRSVRGRRLSAERDPGDTVPPGVAVRTWSRWTRRQRPRSRA